MPAPDIEQSARAAAQAKAREKLQAMGMTPHTPSHPTDDSAVMCNRLWWTNCLLACLLWFQLIGVGAVVWEYFAAQAFFLQFSKQFAAEIDKASTEFEKQMKAIR